MGGRAVSDDFGSRSNRLRTAISPKHRQRGQPRGAQRGDGRAGVIESIRKVRPFVEQASRLHSLDQSRPESQPRRPHHNAGRMRAGARHRRDRIVVRVRYICGGAWQRRGDRNARVATCPRQRPGQRQQPASGADGSIGEQRPLSGAIPADHCPCGLSRSHAGGRSCILNLVSCIWEGRTDPNPEH